MRLRGDLGGALTPRPWRVLEPQVLIYVSGPMTGQPNFNREAFEELRQYIESEPGYTAIIPGDGEEYTVDELIDMAAATPENREQWLRKDVEDILRCDEVWVLPGWEQSRGSTFEILIALELGIPVVTKHNGEVNRDDITWEVTR
ncbi:hypothetical protein LCGC14_1405950 [marine sediment metagenome]|uniref:DUF4406 domain-containing protein n=1 Tax=marine sediment metagenome TaxID=412755 RepID=A0A0F9KGN0_9ZZZZ